MRHWLGYVHHVGQLRQAQPDLLWLRLVRLNVKLAQRFVCPFPRLLGKVGMGGTGMASSMSGVAACHARWVEGVLVMFYVTTETA